MKQGVKGLVVSILLFILPAVVLAENIDEIRKLTEDEWLEMTTEERLRALSTSLSHEENQTYLGDFGRDYQKYQEWGYEFYEMEDRYENYAFRGFENYNIIENRRRRWSYNEFGDRIPRMGHSATLWREEYFGDGQFRANNPGGYINSFGSNFDGVWVARESTDDWAISVIGAGALRSKFTPLTLSMPSVDGMRIDFQSTTTQISILNSQMIANRATGVEAEYMPLGGVMLRGGYLRRKFGVLTLGASYVNEYITQGTRDGGDSWYGTAHNYMPTPVIVGARFVDDSPDDNEGGPTVYDVRIKINGRYREDIPPIIVKDSLGREKTTAITNRSLQAYIDPPQGVLQGDAEHDFLRLNESIVKYGDYLFMNDYRQGHNNDYGDISLDLMNDYYEEIDPASLPVQVSGQDYLVFMFDLTSVTGTINRVEIEAMVANDYRIDTAQIYTSQAAGGHATDHKNTSWYDGTYWTTRAQSEGNVKDGSNLDRVTVDVGWQVASIVYGFDADFNYRGLRIKGEFVTNSNHYMFADGAAGSGQPTQVATALPNRTGHRWSQMDNAYYITAEKDWNSFGFAGEVFKMGKFYKPWLDYHTGTSQRSSYSTRNYTVRLPLIEDNDDEDMYPDNMWEQRAMSSSTSTSVDPDGVFPGNDADNDGIADNNKNLNGVPDYDENFLMFDVDPDEFVLGNDYNNNNIPDFREDDMKIDTPYDLDRRGHHYFFRYTPVNNVNLFAGSYRTEGVGQSIRTNNDYFKAQVDYNVFDVGTLYAEYRYEEIQDNFRDPYIQVSTAMRSGSEFVLTGVIAATERFNRELYYDELEYKNSKVNRLFLDSTIRAIPSITVQNHVKLESNDQVEGIMYDSTYQPHDVINTLAMVNKIIYTKRFGNFEFAPGIKFRTYKKARSESLQPLDHYIMRIPMIMLNYDVSEQTEITLGFQGFNGLPLQYKDYVQPENDYEQKNLLLQVSNMSDYFGYQVWTGAGFQVEEVSYDSIYRKYEEYKSSQFFVRVLLGW